MTVVQPQVVADHLEKVREMEAAFMRFQDGTPAHGDYMLLHGTDYQQQEGRNADRLRAVRVRREKAGTAQRWREAKANLPKMEVKVAALLSKNGPVIQQLEAEIVKLKTECQVAEAGLADLRAEVNGMASHRGVLRDNALLPPVIAQEIELLERAAIGDDRVEFNELMRDIKELEDRNRLWGVDYMNICKAHKHKAGHDFFKGIDSITGMWEEFDEWATRRLEVLKGRLSKMRGGWDREVIDRIESLRSFYTADLS